MVVLRALIRFGRTDVSVTVIYVVTSQSLV